MFDCLLYTFYRLFVTHTVIVNSLLSEKLQKLQSTFKQSIQAVCYNYMCV